MSGFNVTSEILNQMYDVQTNPFSSRNKKKASHPLNNMTKREEWERVLWRITMEKVAARFEWSGLPDNVPAFYLEKLLAEKGQALIFETETDGIFVGSGTPEGDLNHYGEHTRYRVNSIVSDLNKTYDLITDNAVLVKNNLEKTSEWNVLAPYIRDMAEIKVTQAINLQTMKTPFIVEGDQRAINSYLLQLGQIQAGQMYIAIDRQIKDGLSVLDLKTPFYLDKLQQHYTDIKNEMMEILGINSNPNAKKKERMITSEVETNEEETEFNLQTRLALRVHAAKQWNKKTGQNISVKLSEVYDDDNAEFSNRLDNPGRDNGVNGGMDE